MKDYDPKRKFPLGHVVATPAAMAAIIAAGQSTHDFLVRHVHCDWGDVGEEDRKANEEALETGERLLSVYRTNRGLKVWVITEAERSATTILLPHEY
jgi:hypothetical protein